MTPVQVQKVHTLTGHRDAVYTVVSGPEPYLVFSAAGDGMVVKWDLRNPDVGELIAQLPNSVYALHFLPGSQLLVAAHNYDGIHLLNWQEKKEVSSLKLTESAIFDLQSHGSQLFVAGGDGVVTVVDLQTMTIVRKLAFSEKSARTMAVSDKRQELAVGYSDHFIRIFDLKDFSLKNEWQGHTNSVFTVRYNGDQSLLLSGSRDARIKAWDAGRNYQQEAEVVAHMFAINSLAFSPDGKHFVTCSLDKAIKLWDADQLRLLKVVDKARHAGHGTSVNKLLWTAYDGQVISASDDRTISIWKFIF